MYKACAYGILLLAAGVFPNYGWATTLNELKVGVRVFDFMVNPPHGRVPLALIYDGENKSSIEDARIVMSWLEAGINSGKTQLEPHLLEVHQLSNAPGFRVGFLADGSDAQYDRVLDYAQRNHTLIVSSELSCVQSGRCAVGVTSTPRVEVFVNQAAAASCGIEFTEAFRMMVREY